MACKKQKSKLPFALALVLLLLLGLGGRRCRGDVVQFIFGDSLSDVGNNNYLTKSLARAALPWYGIDFDTGMPNGRFCNGRTVADIVGDKMGLPRPLAFLDPSLDENVILKRGVNFASGGGGILNETSSLFIKRFSLYKQIELFHTCVIADTEILAVQVDRAVPGDAGVHAAEDREGGGGQAVRRGLLRGGHGRQRLHQQLPPPRLFRLVDVQRRNLRPLYGEHPGGAAEAAPLPRRAATHLLRAGPHGLHPAAADPHLLRRVPGVDERAGEGLQRAGRRRGGATVVVAGERDVPVRRGLRLLPGCYRPTAGARVQQLTCAVLLTGVGAVDADMHAAVHAVQGPEPVRVPGRVPPNRPRQRAHRTRDAPQAQHHRRRRQLHLNLSSTVALSVFCSGSCKHCKILAFQTRYSRVTHRNS